MKAFLTALLVGWSLATMPSLVQAEDPADETVEEEALDLFDDDAEETVTGWSQFTAAVGYMWLDADGRFDLVGSSGDRVTVIDLDRLGIDDSKGSLWATLNWRSRDSNWGAWFAYWSFSSAGFRIWEDELVLEDEVIVPIGAAVVTDITTDWYILEATYSFIQNDHWDAGIGFGVHVVDIETTLAVDARFGDAKESISVSSLDSLAPLPNFLGYLHYRHGERWHFTTRAGWFGLSYDKYSGEMLNFHALARYNLSDRWAVEAGYQFVELDVDIDEGSYVGLFDMDFSGPLATLRFNF